MLPHILLNLKHFGAAAATPKGPFCFEAVQVYRGGADDVQAYRAGSEVTEVYGGGAEEIQGECR